VKGEPLSASFLAGGCGARAWLPAFRPGEFGYMLYKAERITLRPTGQFVFKRSGGNSGVWRRRAKEIGRGEAKHIENPKKQVKLNA
jgi:hypothetical protein